MLAARFTTSAGRSAGALGIAIVLAIAALVAAGGLAAPPPASAALLGKPGSSPSPNCPRACNVLATVTGFQVRNKRIRNPFIARKDGYIVAWKVKLGLPDQDARQFFNSNFRTPHLTGPSAQISILKRTDPGRYRLVRQSPNVRLASYYNGEGIITLNRPLFLRKGFVVALTTRTWLPNLVTASRTNNSIWRASRPRSRCGDEFATEAKPHRNDGSIRSYRCVFGDRLLYWAYFTPSG